VRPYYEQDGITIYHGDCREILPSVLGNALVVDPPYGIGWGRATWKDDPAAYPELMRWLVTEGQRIGGWCFVFQAMSNAAKWHEWFPDGWRIFAACKNFAQVRKTGAWHAWDPVIFWNSGPNSGPNSGHVNRDWHIGNVAGLLSTPIGHPCPRPVDTMAHIVQIAAPAGGIVVDPFAGSGSTLRAALDTGRRAVGIEIEERYCEIAARRLSQTVLDLGGVA
jgi:site-specific DNA-methyltransferase (adenine-specific)